MASGATSRLGVIPNEGIKAPCVTIAISNITLNGLQTVGGVVLSDNDRVIVTGQDDTTENGIYIAKPLQDWERAADFNAADDVANGQLVINSDTGDVYQLTVSGAWVPGTNTVTFSAVTTLSTTLVPTDVGVTVQGWSAVLDATTASFLTADEAKLDGIEPGATADQTAGEIEAVVAHDNLQSVSAAEHVKWALTGGEVLHTSRYTNTVYSHPNHTGDVASTGDGATVIGAKKVTLAMMADGVDGELITYDASGVAAKVSVGTAAQVLTSNGAGAAPTFQSSSGSTSGTWTPVISDGVNNATMGSSNYGGYIKIGSYVWLMANVITTSLGSVSGNLRITGIPFEVTHISDASGSIYFSTCQGMAFGSTAYHPFGELAPTQDWISLLLQDTAAGTSAMQASEWSANGRGVLHGMYLAV